MPPAYVKPTSNGKRTIWPTQSDLQSGRRLRRRCAFHATLQSLGPAALPGPRRRPPQFDQAQVRLRRPARSAPSRRQTSASRTAASFPPTSSSPRPASCCKCGGVEVSVDGRGSIFRRRRTIRFDVFRRTDLASALTTGRPCRRTAIRPIEALPALDFSSGYVQRSIAKMPKQDSRRPWRLYQNYALDIVSLRWGKVDAVVMQYSRRQLFTQTPEIIP